MKPARVMVVEDEAVVSKGIQSSLEKLGYEVHGAFASGQRAVEAALADPPDLILMDIRIKGPMDGIDAALHIKEKLDTPIIFLTAYADQNKLDRAKQAGPYGYLVKPFEETELRAAIEMAIFKARMERELRTREEWSHTTLSSIGDAVITTDTGGLVSYLNPVAEELTGWPLEEAKGRPIKDIFVIINQDTRAPVENPVDVVLQKGIVVGLANHTNLIARDGSERPIADSGAPIHNRRGETTGVVLVFRDVSKEYSSLRALELSERRYRQLVESMQEGVGLVNAEGVFTFVNQAYAKMLGRSVQDLLGNSPEDFVAEEFRDEQVKQMALRKQGVDKPYEATLQHKDGTLVYTLNSPRVLYGQDGNYQGAMVVITDITEKTLVHKALRRSQALLDEVGAIAKIGGWEMDLVNRTAQWTKVTYSIMEVAPGDPVPGPDDHHDYYPPEYKPLIEKAINDLIEYDTPLEVEAQLNTAKGNLIWVRILGRAERKDGQCIRICGTLQDITLLKKAQQEKTTLERQLRQSQKMEAMGTLAGGIAHDFNNLLAAILGYAQLAADDLPDEHPVQENLDKLLQAGKRAVDLVRQILSFSRPHDHSRQNLRLGPLVEDCLKLVRASLPATVEIKQNLYCPRDTIFADRTQLNQVIINLCANAGQAMQDQGGTLTVTLEEVEDPDIIHGAGGDEPPLLCLSASDTGPGMDRETLNRVFDPFFTTKSAGQGSGMGLAVVHGIIKSHGGAIAVESEPGHGATFKVYLPLSETKADETNAKPTAKPAGGNERILFVDDEPMLVSIGSRALGGLGYQVKGFTDSREAMQAFFSDPYGFDLVVTDLTMPGITGVNLAKEMLAVRPELPIILCTGYSEDVTTESVSEIGIAAVAMKPLMEHKLARLIRQALDKAQRPKASPPMPASSS